jgi:signal transduction histidine kinase
MASRLAGFPQSLAMWLATLPARRQELVQDMAFGIALAAVNVVSLLPYRAHLHPLWLALTLVACQGVFLGWRRSWPVPVAIAIGGVRDAYDQIGFGFAPLPLGPAIAFYTVMDRSGTLLRWLTVAGVTAGVTLSQAAPGHSQPYDAIFQAMIFLAAGVAGLLSRAKRATVQAAESRAARAEAVVDSSVAQAAMRERTRIARELHDVVAHHVSLIAVQSEAAASLLPGRPDEAQRSVGIIGDTARQALSELRRLLGVLRGPAERIETVPSASLGTVSEVLDQVRGAGLRVDFEVVGTPSPLGPGVDLTAYRIIQEALTNTIRHGRATQAAVTLTYEPGYITVSITDSGGDASEGLAVAVGVNGTGAAGRQASAPGPLLQGAGLGLAGIAERVASCGGHLSVGPTPAYGFAVIARLPSL